MTLFFTLSICLTLFFYLVRLYDFVFLLCQIVWLCFTTLPDCLVNPPWQESWKGSGRRHGLSCSLPCLRSLLPDMNNIKWWEPSVISGYLTVNNPVEAHVELDIESIHEVDHDLVLGASIERDVDWGVVCTCLLHLQDNVVRETLGWQNSMKEIPW